MCKGDCPAYGFHDGKQLLQETKSGIIAIQKTVINAYSPEVKNHEKKRPEEPEKTN